MTQKRLSTKDWKRPIINDSKRQITNDSKRQMIQKNKWIKKDKLWRTERQITNDWKTNYKLLQKTDYKWLQKDKLQMTPDTIPSHTDPNSVYLFWRLSACPPCSPTCLTFSAGPWTRPCWLSPSLRRKSGRSSQSGTRLTKLNFPLPSPPP